MNKVIAFSCSHCLQISRYKASILRHEENSCKNNKSRKSCLSCVNYEHYEGYSDTHEEPGEMPYWICTKIDKELDPMTINKNIICSDFDRVKS